MKAQQDRLLDYLNRGGTVDGIKAWHELGIYRLASRIHDLRARGINVADEWVKGTNQFGEKVRWKQYYLEDRQ